MKKYLLFCGILICFAFSVYAQQYDNERDFITVTINDGSAVEITGYTGRNRNIRIPPSIGNLPVTSIGEMAFCGKPTELAISSGIFSGRKFMQNLLTSVTIPAGVTSIGQYAFAYNELASVTIPIGVTSIGEAAFMNNKLRSVNFPNGLTSISGMVLYNNQLTSIIIPDSVTSIGSGAFLNNRITSLFIPDSVISIGSTAFALNRIIRVTISSGVSVANRAFDNKFQEFYTENDSSAGTYVYVNGSWREQQ